MEQTFMTIHNLSPNANILFASESIIDILGYHPHEVQGRSCFDYFHPDEVPFARSVHSRGVLLDKAAVLHYARILSRDGRWISCECCFTVVHDVLVACTSIYRRGEKSERRAIEAPQIRRIFSCSPRDPRYHMLEHLSPKFRMTPMEREPRAALILNRFTRTLTVMFATNAVASVLGVRPDQIKDKSFYECIQENCLADAIKCLESAKANDSIAYLRFWYRDPRRPEDFEDEDEDNESEGQPGETSSDSEGGGAELGNSMDVDFEPTAGAHIKVENHDDSGATSRPDNSSTGPSSISAESTMFPSGANSRAYQTPLTEPSTTGHGMGVAAAAPAQARQHQTIPTFELEAVVSCTSDGLVVVLRKARPAIPTPQQPILPFGFENGLFAAPWGQQPIRPQYPPDLLYTFRPPLMPQYMPLRENVKAAGGPPLDQLMKSIRDVAVFAWALVGINGSLATYVHGIPQGEAQPPDGLPVWDPNAGITSYLGPENQAAQRWADFERGKAPMMETPAFRAPLQYESPHARGRRPEYSLGNYTYDRQMWPPVHQPELAAGDEQHLTRHGIPPHYSQHHQQPPESTARRPLQERLWGETPPSENQDDRGVPTRRSEAEEPSQGFRYPWQ